MTRQQVPVVLFSIYGTFMTSFGTAAIVEGQDYRVEVCSRVPDSTDCTSATMLQGAAVVFTLTLAVATVAAWKWLVKQRKVR